MPTNRDLLTALLLGLGATSALAQTFPVRTFDAGGQRPGDLLGAAVAVHGTQAVLGAFGHDHKNVPTTGGAWIRERLGNTGWSETAKLAPSDLAANDQFGFATAITRDRAIVGSPMDDDLGSASGSAYVFERQPNGTWTQISKLTASDGAAGHDFGTSVAIDGDFAAVGAPDARDRGVASGSVYVFQRQANGTWLEVAKLRQTDRANNDEFGKSVAISGTRVLGGAYLEDAKGFASGSAYLFERQNDGTWPQVAKLVASDGAAADFFGYAVGLAGDYAVAGAWADDDGGSGSGSAYVYERQANGTWAERAKLVHPNASGGDHFGQAVAIDGDVALIGAIHDIVDNKIGAGSAHAYARTGNGTWRHIASFADRKPAKHDNFGHAVSIDDGRVLIGVSNDDAFGHDAGSGQLFFTFGGSGKTPPITRGTGTAGCDGLQAMWLNLPPQIGTSNFALTCSNAPLSRPGFLLLGDAADIRGSDRLGLGIKLHVDLFASRFFLLLPVLNGPTRDAVVPMPLPNSPGLAGAVLHAQTAWFWTSCSLPPFGLSSSNLLTMTLLRP